jgi:hypothetical protein
MVVVEGGRLTARLLLTTTYARRREVLQTGRENRDKANDCGLAPDFSRENAGAND